MTLQFPVIPRTKAYLEKMATPETVKGGQSEAVAWTFYDTVTYASAATTELEFFTNTRATRQLSNLSPAGSLPSPQYFEIYGFQFDVLAPARASMWDDVSALLWGTGTAGQGSPTFLFTWADKRYGPKPLSALQGTGGIHGFSDAAAAPIQYANVGAVPGGYWEDGAIVIPPQESFSATITWPAAVTLVNGDTDVRVSMVGVLHRKVV